MANALLTPSVITKEALAILHQKLNFVTNINTQYDDQYAKSGAKIGNDLKIRLPNEFTVRSGATLIISGRGRIINNPNRRHSERCGLHILI